MGVKQRLRGNFLQNWASELDMSSRAFFNKHFAHFHMHDYLEIVTVKKFRTALARLRVSSHRLEVEMGRWVRVNRKNYSERKCKLCEKLEDEYHIIFECPIYKELRTLYSKVLQGKTKYV